MVYKHVGMTSLLVLQKEKEKETNSDHSYDREDIQNSNGLIPFLRCSSLRATLRALPLAATQSHRLLMLVAVVRERRVRQVTHNFALGLGSSDL